jgi:hypothetical protein
MKPLFKSLSFCAICLVSCLFSCTNLKQVNNYASTSYICISKYDEIGYSFVKHDAEDSLLKFSTTYHIVREPESAYSEAKKADSVTNLIYCAIKGYFDGLAKLSDPNLTNYNMDALNNALVTGQFGRISVDSTQASAYSKIAGAILSLATDAHRGNLLKKYIVEAKQPLDVLLKSFIFILERDLKPELRGKKNDLYIYYSALGKIDINDEKNFYDLLNNGSNQFSNKIDTAYRKEFVIFNKKLNSIYKFELQKAAADYYRQVWEINRKEQQIDVYIKSLNEIQAGYQKLYDNIDRISEENVKEEVSASAGKIRTIISSFNAIKN